MRLPNHFHLLVRTRAAPLSDLMRALNTGYAVGFNRRHRRSGYVFQNRFKSFLVEEEPYLLGCFVTSTSTRYGQVW